MALIEFVTCDRCNKRSVWYRLAQDILVGIISGAYLERNRDWAETQGWEKRMIPLADPVRYEDICPDCQKKDEDDD